MRTMCTHHKFMAGILIAVATNASAELTLRLEPEAEDSGTSSMPARFGQAKSSKGSGVVAQFAVSYNGLPQGSKSGKLIYEPYAAITVNDNASIATDEKSAEVGVKAVFGDLTVDKTTWLLDGAISRTRDRVATTSSSEVKLGAEPVATWLKFGVGYTQGKWGLYLRPKINLYHLKTIESEDASAAPTGSATGLLSELSLDMFLPFSDRVKFTLSGAYAKDQSVSGGRVKDDYKKGKAQAQYAFYDVVNPPKGKALFSLVLDRSVGREALSTSTNKKASTGLYLGVRL